MKRLIAVDDNKQIYFSFNTAIQSLVETFMTRLGYDNTGYYLNEDCNTKIAELIANGYAETEIIIWQTVDYTGELTFLYMVI